MTLDIYRVGDLSPNSSRFATKSDSNVRCFGPWAKQFQINPKGPLIHACIYGKVGDFSLTLLLQVEWGQLKRLSYLHLVEAIGERKGRTTRARARSPRRAGRGGANGRACTSLASPRRAGRGQWARMHDMRVNGPAISRFNPCGCAASFCYLEVLHAWRRLRWPIW